jgi:hypothetical protein
MATATISLSRKFLSDQADVSLDLSSPGAPALMAALRDGVGTIPAGEIILGDIQAKAGGDGSVTFGGGQSKGKVTFRGHAEAAFAVGVHLDGSDAIKAVAPSPELADGLRLLDPEATRYVVVRATYDIAASTKGSVALGVGAAATFGVAGSSSGLFAVLHRFHDAEPALQVFKDTFMSWALPTQLDNAKDLAPGTWLVAEVDGSIALQLGVQAGYDFSWIREIPDGALKGDIGLRVQLGASAAFGFEASGKYAVVLAREAADEVIRLRLYKLAKKGWNFALDARVGIKTELPPFFDRPHKTEDLVAAIFGLNENQIIEVLRETRAFVNSNVSLQDKLAGVLMQLGGKAIEETTGLSPQEVKDIYEAGRQRLLEFIGRFDTLLKNGGHDLTSMLLSLSGTDFNELQAVLKDIVATGGETQVQQLVGGLLAKAGFERSLIGRFIESAIGPALSVLNNTERAKELKSLAGEALAVLEGKTLEQLLDFIRRKIHFDQVTKVVTETDFNRLDNLLKDRLAAFLGKQRALLEDLKKIQDAIQKVLANVDKFYSLALAAAKREIQFSFAANYARNTTKTALVDVSFDLSKAGAVALLRKAVGGDFDDLLLKPDAAVTINAAELTHNIKRNVSSELTMPFGAISGSAETVSSAKLQVVEDNGRVLVYTLDATDSVSERKRLFGARSGRDSTLTVAATLPLAITGNVRIWKDSSFNYSYRMERAVVKMRASQLLKEIGPLVEKYVPAPFSNPQARSFEEFVADLDKALDNKDPNSGTHDIGDTLITLDLTAPSAYLRAWSRAPANRKDPLYMNLSRVLQAKLKELVTFYYFSDPARYKDLAAAAAPIVFSCLPTSTTIKLNGDGEVERFDTDKDLHWDQMAPDQIRAMSFAPRTISALVVRLKSIADTLRGIPELASTAQFYAPDQVDDVLAAALRRFAHSNRPELLGSLLDLESQLVEKAVDTGREMARFREATTKKPTDALKNLAEFGEDLVNTFNGIFGSHPFMSGASRPLGTLLFLEAAAAFDPSAMTARVASLMNITVIQSGKLTIDELLDGKITEGVILHEQPFVQV